MKVNVRDIPRRYVSVNRLTIARQTPARLNAAVVSTRRKNQTQIARIIIEARIHASTKRALVTFANIDVALILQTVIYYSIKQDFTRGSI